MSSTNEEHIMDDEEIKEKVEALVGKGTRIIDCEKTSSHILEEVVMLNGIPVKLKGDEGDRIREALKIGQTPPPELLGEILLRAGIETNPVELETTATVKSTTKTSEVATFKDKKGQLVDETMKEFEEDDEFQAHCVEVWKKDEEEKNSSRKLEYDNKTHHVIPSKTSKFMEGAGDDGKAAKQSSTLGQGNEKKCDSPNDAGRAENGGKKKRWKRNKNKKNKESSTSRPSLLARIKAFLKIG